MSRTPRSQQRIRAACSLISAGTELHYVHETRRQGGELALGYCSTGVVEQVGAGVTGFSVGDRVSAMGWGHAVHAESICVPYRLCVRLPDELPFEHAVFANLAATALHAVHRATLTAADTVLVVGAARIAPRACGVFHDDAIYVSTAQALAEGKGYRLIGVPGAPLQTKYPVLYPAVLAAVWRVWPEFPDNLLAMQGITLLCGAAAVGLVYLYLVRFGYASRGAARRPGTGGSANA